MAFYLRNRSPTQDHKDPVLFWKFYIQTYFCTHAYPTSFVGKTVPLILSAGYFPSRGRLPYIHNSALGASVLSTQRKNIELFLCIVFTPLGLSKLSDPAPQLREPARLCPNSPPCAAAWKLFLDGKLGQSSDSPCLFAVSQEPPFSHALPNSQ